MKVERPGYLMFDGKNTAFCYWAFDGEGELIEEPIDRAMLRAALRHIATVNGIDLRTVAAMPEREAVPLDVERAARELVQRLQRSPAPTPAPALPWWRRLLG